MRKKRYNKTLEAYYWWNSSLSLFGNLDSPPVLPSPIVAQKVWNTFCPILDLLSNPELPPKQYWKIILKIVSLFGNEKIPDPMTQFPQFIIHLNELRPIISPNSVACALAFIEIYHYQLPSRFLLYQAPIFFGNPIIYFNSIICLAESNHILWRTIAENSSLAEQFFNLHSTFLMPANVPSSSLIYHHRQNVLYILYSLVLSIPPNALNANILANRFCDIAIKLIPNSAFELQVTATRYVISISKEKIKKVTRDDLVSRLSSLLFWVKSTPMTYYVINYALTCPFISSFKLFKIMLNNMNSPYPLTLIQENAVRFGLSRCLFSLARLSFRSHIWHRSSFQTIREIIFENSNSDEVKKWTLTFVRRAMLFIPFAFAIHKYNRKCVFISESISSLLNLRMNWLTPVIVGTALVIIQSGMSPSYLSHFFPLPVTNQVDEISHEEYIAFQKMEFDLKKFPFQKDGFVIPNIQKDKGKNPQRELKPIPPKTITKKAKAFIKKPKANKISNSHH